jgi:hypothetical protein
MTMPASPPRAASTARAPEPARVGLIARPSEASSAWPTEATRKTTPTTKSPRAIGAPSNQPNRPSNVGASQVPPSPPMANPATPMNEVTKPCRSPPTT